MRGRLALVTVVAIGAFATQQSNPHSIDWRSYHPTTKDVESFFQGQLSDSNNSSAVAHYDARSLRFVSEEPLADSVGPSVPEVFRLLVETRPDDLPVVIRLSIKADGSGEAVTKVVQNSANTPTLTENRKEEVSARQVSQFRQLAANSDFWSVSAVPTLDITHVQMGEVGWTLEGEKNGTYHVVWRTTSKLGSIRNAAMFLLIDVGKIDLASLDSRPNHR